MVKFVWGVPFPRPLLALHNNKCWVKLFVSKLCSLNYCFKWHSYRKVFWRRLRQSIVTIFRVLDRRNRVTSLRRFVLGAKQPVTSHISSHPPSSLALHATNFKEYHRVEDRFASNHADTIIGAATARVARVRTLPTFGNLPCDPPKIL